MASERESSEMLERRAVIFGIGLGWLALGGAGDGRAQATEDETAEGGDVVVVDTRKGRDLDEERMVHVRVRNSLVPTQSVVVSVDHGFRPEYVLGVVRSNETVEFLVDTRQYTGSFRVIATSGPPPSGVTIVNAVQPLSRSRAHWNLGVNLMRIERIEAEQGT